MKPFEPSCLKSRRDFFRKAATMGAAVLFGTTGSRRVDASSAPSPEHSKTQGRYRETEHIRNYYQRAAL